MTSNKLSYESVGASADKKGLHKILENLGHHGVEPYFCKLTEDLNGDENFKSFIHCDGAGTKSIISYLHYKATGSVEYFKRLAHDALFMNLDDVYCVGIPQSLLYANALARNAKLIPDEAIQEIISEYIALGKKMQSLGIPLNISGGETADCGDVVRTLLVDGTLVGRIQADQLVSPSNIVSGDVVIGLSSSGKTTYEDVVNSGIGSNGLSLARHALLSKENAVSFPEILDPNLGEDNSYQGPFKVSDTPEGLGMSIGDALSSPTRTYSPVLKAILESEGKNIKGIIHLTGGAHGKVLRFLNNVKIVKDKLPAPAPIYSLIQTTAEIPSKEMYRVFNMGIRMEVYCKKESADNVLAICKSFNLDAGVVGHVEESDKPMVELRLGDGEVVEYTL
jgi:phosphoribosylformylglycinamidine cyclo-ligase